MKKCQLLMAATVLGLGIAAAATGPNTPTAGVPDAEIAKKLAHEIRMYSRYSIFDDIRFKVNDGAVELYGDVTIPVKKGDLGRIAQHVPGVTSLTNDLKVLPLSPMDWQLRRQVAGAIFRDPVLSRYGLQAEPPIHIIVDHGHVTLEGVVRTDMEKNVAGLRANGAGMSFGMVTNNLMVENPGPKKS